MSARPQEEVAVRSNSSLASVVLGGGFVTVTSSVTTSVAPWESVTVSFTG